MYEVVISGILDQGVAEDLAEYIRSGSVDSGIGIEVREQNRVMCWSCATEINDNSETATANRELHGDEDDITAIAIDKETDIALANLELHGDDEDIIDGDRVLKYGYNWDK